MIRHIILSGVLALTPVSAPVTGEELAPALLDRALYIAMLPALEQLELVAPRPAPVGLAATIAHSPWPTHLHSWLRCVIHHESGGNPRAFNGHGRDMSYGLLQINMRGRMGPVRRRLFHIATNDALYDPATNLRAGWIIYQAQGRRAWTANRYCR